MAPILSKTGGPVFPAVHLGAGSGTVSNPARNSRLTRRPPRCIYHVFMIFFTSTDRGTDGKQMPSVEERMRALDLCPETQRQEGPCFPRCSARGEARGPRHASSPQGSSDRQCGFSWRDGGKCLCQHAGVEYALGHQPVRGQLSPVSRRRRRAPSSSSTTRLCAWQSPAGSGCSRIPSRMCFRTLPAIHAFLHLPTESPRSRRGPNDFPQVYAHLPAVCIPAHNHDV